MLQWPHMDWFEPSQKSADTRLELRYHGTAGFTLTAQQTTIILDPYVTRPGILRTLLGRLVPNEPLIREVFPKADGVLVGHSHHDHILDAPFVAQSTGAKFVGSKDAANVAIAAGLPPSQIIETQGREDIKLGAARVRGIPSNHGRVYFNRVTLPGSIPVPPPWPPRVWDLRHGDVLNWMVEVGGFRVVHIDSAEVIDSELEGMTADIVCLCAIGRRHRPGLVESVVKALKPRWIIPCHWDWFFTPYGRPPPLLPGVNLPGLLDEIRNAGAKPVLLPVGGTFLLSESDLVG
jgi:L-ascorbate metabolism protein UlaG (beta-lactamase superfamily)